MHGSPHFSRMKFFKLKFLRTLRLNKKGSPDLGRHPEVSSCQAISWYDIHPLSRSVGTSATWRKALFPPVTPGSNQKPFLVLVTEAQK